MAKKPVAEKKPRKVKEAEEEVQDASLDETLKKITVAKFGASDGSPEVNYWLKSGILLLDLAIANGFPGGKVIELFGDWSSGKSALGFQLIKQAQRLGGHGVLIDAENGASVSMAEDIIGMSLKNHCQYVKPDSAEDALEAIEMYAKAAVQYETPTVIMLDSVAGLCPEAITMNKEKEMDASRPANVARLLSHFFQRGILKTIAGSNVHLVFVNQTRDTLNSNRFQGPTYTTPGGHAIPFYAGVRIECNASKAWTEKIGKNDNALVGKMVTLKIRKNKFAAPMKEVRVPFYFRPDRLVLGWDNIQSQLVYLAEMQVMHQVSGRYALWDQNMYMRQWREKIQSDPELAERFRLLTRETFLKEHGLWDEDPDDVSSLTVPPEEDIA